MTQEPASCIVCGQRDTTEETPRFVWRCGRVGAWHKVTPLKMGRVIDGINVGQWNVIRIGSFRLVVMWPQRKAR